MTGLNFERTKLQGHLLYIDITQICGVGCEFCMYADKHKSGISMQLSDIAKDNLASLINSPNVKRISVSGEGEPLNNFHVFHEILKLSSGAKAFEFITSGFFPHDKLESFYEATNSIMTSNGDTCNIRLSADHHHIDKILHRPHGFSIHYLFNKQPESLTFSFRSIDTDRDFTQSYLVNELNKWELPAKIEVGSVLEDVIVVNGQKFSIDYKNLVHPSPSTPAGYLDLQGYIDEIEKKVGKRFTLGSLNKSPQVNGMDLTIKPNGGVFLYGVECELLGNIHTDRICWNDLALYIESNPLIRTLYTQPFVELMSQFSDNKIVQNLIQKVNNPYWLIKEMALHDGLIEQIETT